jgi:hypothetical protein
MNPVDNIVWTIFVVLLGIAVVAFLVVAFA